MPEAIDGLRRDLPQRHLTEPRSDVLLPHAEHVVLAKSHAAAELVRHELASVDRARTAW